MKTIYKLELDDSQRNALACLFDGRETSREATRADITAFLDGCIDYALGLALDDCPSAGTIDGVANDVIIDINEGGWTFIGQPATEAIDVDPAEYRGADYGND